MHSHFLPGMDDGCKTAAEAIEVLKNSYMQGVRRIFATPHYYPVESVQSFLERREAAYRDLLEAAREEKDIPRICLGAEVAYRPGLGYAEDLDKLCLGTSRYLLLEMPFTHWNREVLRDVRNMYAAAGITPIIAHVERYGEQNWRELQGMDVLVQMNAGCLLRPTSRHMAKKLLKTEFVQLLGTDCHNLTDRAPNLGKAAQYLQKKKLADTMIRIMQLSNALFEEATNKDAMN